MPSIHRQLIAIGTHLEQRRGAILDRWRLLVGADPQLAVGASLPIQQLFDHLTALLEDFELRLKSGGVDSARATTSAERGDGAAHGLHRWQQGYALSELARELGRLNLSMVAELELLTGAVGGWTEEALSEVRRLWATTHGVAVVASADQFNRLQQIEAAGQVQDLEAALESLQQLEAQRGALWQEAAHDLRGNLAVVSVAAHGLVRSASHDSHKERFAAALAANVRSLGVLLADVTSLARLQGGQEVRAAAPIDAGEAATRHRECFQ